MRRLLASLAVLSVILAPTLHLWCEGSCDESSAMSMCHHHHAADRALTPAHDFETHAQPAALLAKPTAIPLPVLFAVAPSHAIADAGHLAGHISRVAFSPLKRPPVLLTLRI